jgi:AraC-like DNA-binding protein
MAASYRQWMNDRLYKRAALASNTPRPLWYVGDGISTFAGPLQRNALHSHSVPVLLSGLYGSFRLRSEGERWVTCRMAIVPAGIPYEFDMAGEPLSVIYLEPSVAGVSALVPLLRDAEDLSGLLFSRTGESYGLRAFYEDAHSATWAGDALRDVITFSKARQRRSMDARIGRVLRDLQLCASERRSAVATAQSIALSSSRFQHLFAAEVGVPFRRYRAWQRMLFAIREIGANGANFTTAAHAAGYADQSHFAHHFRRLFGAAASPSMSNIRG